MASKGIRGLPTGAGDEVEAPKLATKIAAMKVGTGPSEQPIEGARFGTAEEVRYRPACPRDRADLDAEG